MDKKFGIAIEYKFYIDGWECILGDVLNIELEDGSILKRTSFENADKNYITIDFYGVDVEIPIDEIIAIEKVI